MSKKQDAFEDVRSYAELLPWLFQITDSVIINKDSALMACFEFEGVDSDCVTEDALNLLSQRVADMTRNLSSYPLTLHWIVRRTRTDFWPEMAANPGASPAILEEPGETAYRNMPDPVSQMIDNKAREGFLRSNNYVNRNFLAVIYNAPSRGGWVDRMQAFTDAGDSTWQALKKTIGVTLSGSATFAYRKEDLMSTIGKFEDILSAMMGQMAELHARRISGDTLINFLRSTSSPIHAFPKYGCNLAPMSGVEESSPQAGLRHPGMEGVLFLDALLPDSTLDLGGKYARVTENAREAVVGAISVKGYPDDRTQPDMGMPGMIQTILSLQAEMTISQVFRIAPRAEMTRHLKMVRQFNELMTLPLMALVKSAFTQQVNENRVNELRAANAQKATQALSSMDAGAVYGWHNLTIAVSRDIAEDDTTRAIETLEKHLAFVGATLDQCGFVHVRERTGLGPALAGCIPGNWQYLARWVVLERNNMSDLAPLRGVLSGRWYNRFLTEQLGRKCPAVTVLPTEYSTPFYFNFHVGDLGHAFVAGPAGMGKSTFMNFLMSQFRKYDARVIIFDKDRSCRIATLLQGGRHVDMAPGGRVRMNPMHLVTDPRHHEFLATWIKVLVEARGTYRMTSNDEKVVWNAIRLTYASNKPELNRLGMLYTLLSTQDGELQAQLEQWVGNGQMARYFDNDEDNFDVDGFVCVEMGTLLENKQVARAFMDYAFYRITHMLDTQQVIRPTLIYLEECWFMLEDEYFAQKVKDWLKTLRKKVAMVAMATQSVDDLADSPVFASLRDNIHTRFFLPNPSATTESLAELYRRQFELTDEQIMRLRNATPKQDYLLWQPGVVRMIQCPLPVETLACLRGDSLAQATFDLHWNDGNPVDERWRERYIHDVLNA